MQLTPVEILKHLGFDVPEEGITINPMDAFLYSKALHLAGGTLNIEAISDEDLLSLHQGMDFLARSHTDIEARSPDAESLLKLRITLKTLLKGGLKATLIK